jgi:hypothetical protein
MQHWDCSASIARIELCRLIAERICLYICFGESDAFQEYITHLHNPRFIKSPMQTMTRDLVKHYSGQMESLIETLKFSVSSMTLTSDIWSGRDKEDCISIVAHYVNYD